MRFKGLKPILPPVRETFIFTGLKEASLAKFTLSTASELPVTPFPVTNGFPLRLSVCAKALL